MCSPNAAFAEVNICLYTKCTLRDIILCFHHVKDLSNFIYTVDCFFPTFRRCFLETTLFFASCLFTFASFLADIYMGNVPSITHATSADIFMQPLQTLKQFLLNTDDIYLFEVQLSDRSQIRGPYSISKSVVRKISNLRL